MDKAEVNLLEPIFDSLNITQESITSCAQFVLDNVSNIDAVLTSFKTSLLKFLESKSHSQNILAMFYVMNEVLYRLRQVSATIEIEKITACFEAMVMPFRNALISQKYVSLILKVLLIWKDKGIMKLDVLEALIQVFQAKMEAGSSIDLAHVDFDYAHLKKYAKKYINYIDWKDRLKKAEESLRHIEHESAEHEEKAYLLAERSKCVEMIGIQANELHKLKELVNSKMHTDFLRMIQDLQRIDGHIEEANKLINS